MTYDEIREKIKNGAYNTKKSFPKSVGLMKPHISKNSEYYGQVMQEFNSKLEARKAALKEYHDDKNRLDREFEDDVIKMLVEGYVGCRGLTDKQAKKVFDRAWGDGHGNGLIEVLDIADDLYNLLYN